MLGLIETRKGQDIIDERRKTRSLVMDTTAKITLVVLARHQTVLNQFGVARNGCKRRFELVGYICRKLAAHTVVIGQNAHLSFKFLTLRFDTLEHGGHLGIRGVGIPTRMVKIHIAQGRDDRAGLAAGHKKQADNADKSHSEDGTDYRKQHSQKARLGLREANHAPVIQSFRLIEHDLTKC